MDDSRPTVDEATVGLHIDIGTCASVHRNVVMVSMLVGAFVMAIAAWGMG